MSYKKSKIINHYKDKFISIFVISIILTLIPASSFINEKKNSILKFSTIKIDDNKIVDLTIHANTDLDDGLLNLYMSHLEVVKRYSTSGSVMNLDGAYLYENFKNIMIELINNEKDLLINVKKGKGQDSKYDLFTIFRSTEIDHDTSVINNKVKEILNQTERLLKERILQQVSLEREEKKSSLEIMDGMIPSDYREKLEIIIKKKNQLLKQRLSTKKLEDLVTILNFKNQPLNSGNYLEATEEIHDKYGKIILLFFVFHLMTFLISFFFSINTSKVSVKSQRKK